MVPRPVPTPPKASKSTLTVYQDVTLPGKYNVLVVSVEGGTKGATGTGNSAKTNYLISNSKNFTTTPVANGVYLGLNAFGNTLVAGNSAATTMKGGAGNDCLYAAASVNPVTMYGGSGRSTMVAGAGKATLVGGNLSNSLVAGTGDQLLMGGNNSPSVMYLTSTGMKSTLTGNTLRGGSGKDTLIGGTGYNTLISGSGLATSTVSVAAKKGSTAIKVTSTAELKVGQAITGSGIATGSIIKKISGNTVTLSKKTTAAAPLGAFLTATPTSNTLVGNGLSSSLIASAQGNDSLFTGTAVSSTLKGGTGRDTLTASSLNSASQNTSWLQSGSTGAGNLLQGGSGFTTLVAGTGGADTINGGTGSNLLLITDSNRGNYPSNVVSLSTLRSASNAIGLSLTNSLGDTTLGDTILSSLVNQGVSSLQSIQNFSSIPVSILMGANAQLLGVHTLTSGTKNDTLAYAAPGSMLLDASQSKAGRTSLYAGVDGNDTFLASTVGGDTLVGSGSGNILDARLAQSAVTMNVVSLPGDSTGNNTLYGSKAGYDKITATGTYNSIILQNSNIGSIVGGTSAEGNTLVFKASGDLQGYAFNNVSNISDIQLGGGGSQTVGTLQGSGVNQIIRASTLPSSNKISLNLWASANLTPTGSRTLILRNPTKNGASGFDNQDLVLSGNGIAVGTTATLQGYDSQSITLSLSQPTNNLITPGTSINGWIPGTISDFGSTALLSNATLIGAAFANFYGSSSGGIPYEKTVRDYGGLLGDFGRQYYGTPSELGELLTAIDQAANDASTTIAFTGDVLTGLGHSQSLVGSTGTYFPSTLAPATGTIKSAYYKYNSDHVLYGTATKSSESGSPVIINTNNLGGDYITFSVNLNRRVSNTLISGAFSDGAANNQLNTLVGGTGNNFYQLANPSGYSDTLPWIAASLDAQGVPVDSEIQSGSSIQFLGNSVILNDQQLINVKKGSVTTILTANGRNSVVLGENSSNVGIRSIIGGLGSDTFSTPTSLKGDNGFIDQYYPNPVYLDGSKNAGGITSLIGGSASDTLLGGTGSSTLLGGNGNNSLLGGSGYNYLKTGLGDSTLDGGLGISTLQADAGNNTFIVRNRWTRIFNPDTLNEDVTGIYPEVGTVNTYVNFDPMIGSPLEKFSSPETPDNSPSVTKSPSFASSDLSSFYLLNDFNLLGGANYGVGNSQNNVITAIDDINNHPAVDPPPSLHRALLMGMGGYNTLVAGSYSTLYGFKSDSYASPDLYAFAPIDTETQQFVDGVIGTPGNNSLVAGHHAFLDGGPGFDNGIYDGSGSNTMVGTGGADTLVQRHQADIVSLTGANNCLITTVDLYRVPDNVVNVIMDVTPQLPNSGQVDFQGQRMTASYINVADGLGTINSGTSLQIGNATLSPEIDPHTAGVAGLKAGGLGGHIMQIAYGISNGTVYGAPTDPEADQPLNVSDPFPDQQNPGNLAFTLTWTTPLTPDGDAVGQNMGYIVNYRIVATPLDGSSAVQTPFLTYLNGSSQDLNGTSINPSLTVDNIATSFTDPYTGQTWDESNALISYDFQVTAKETVLPAYTDADGNLIALVPSLIGGYGPDIIYSGLLDQSGSYISSTRPVLTNNPVNPDQPGTIPTPAPWYLTANSAQHFFPTYMDGGQVDNATLSVRYVPPNPSILVNSTTPPIYNDDLLISGLVNDGSGNTFTAYEYINGVPKGVTYSGFNTLVGGYGYDTFVVSNGGQSLSTLNGIVATGRVDDVIKYEKEGSDNLIISCVKYLTLSDTEVAQGNFINKASTSGMNLIGNYGPQYIGGNRLDNTLQALGTNNTLLGAGGADWIINADANGTSATLIGGTAYGLDSIAGALADYANYQKTSIYRDTDPVPVQPNGPGAADNSQYWMVNRDFWMLNSLYDPRRNSDSLFANNSGKAAGDVLDGGAGNDSMIGGSGNDSLYVSSALGYENNTLIANGDVVQDGGGNDWIIYTGSDIYWSGLNTKLNTYDPLNKGNVTVLSGSATESSLGYRLSNDGDAIGGQSISNIKLQDGSPVARWAVGSATSIGNKKHGAAELGSNFLIGNEFSNTLNGGGVGGGDGTGFGLDTLTGGGGSDLFVVGAYYRASSQDLSAVPSTAQDIVTKINTYTATSSQAATDADYVQITDFSTSGSNDRLSLGGTINNYAIGSAPSSFKKNNMYGGTVVDPSHFGIYYINGTSLPNLVAEITTDSAISLGSSYLKVAQLDVNGSSSSALGYYKFSDGGTTSEQVTAGLNYLGFGAMYPISSTDLGQTLPSGDYKFLQFT